MAQSIEDMPVQANEGKRSWKPVMCMHDQGSQGKEHPQPGFFSYRQGKEKSEREKGQNS